MKKALNTFFSGGLELSISQTEYHSRKCAKALSWSMQVPPQTEGAGGTMPLSLQGMKRKERGSWIPLQRTHRELRARASGGRFQLIRESAFQTSQVSCCLELPHTTEGSSQKSEWPLVGKGFQNEMGSSKGQNRVQLWHSEILRICVCACVHTYNKECVHTRTHRLTCKHVSAGMH